MDVLLLFESVHYHITTKKLQVKAIIAWPLYVLNWRNANLTCYYRKAKTSPPNTHGQFPLLHTQPWCWIAAGLCTVGDGNAGWTDPLHLHNIGKSYAGAIINALCSSAVWEERNKLAAWCRKRMLLNTTDWSGKTLKQCEPKENGFSVFHLS